MAAAGFRKSLDSKSQDRGRAHVFIPCFHTPVSYLCCIPLVGGGVWGQAATTLRAPKVASCMTRSSNSSCLFTGQRPHCEPRKLPFA